MKLLDYLKKIRNKLTNEEVYLVNFKKIGFKTDNQIEEEKATNLSTMVILSEEEELLLLENATKDFFPESGSWSSVCFSRPKEYGIGYLPCNLRDDEWLAHTLKITQKLDNINYNKILNFVKTSELFKKEKNNYEQRVIKWQIEWMISGGEGWIVPKEYDEDFINWDENYDIGFRKGIVDTLKAIGMNEKAIEEGIEKNAHLWRDKCMQKAFMNKYDSTFDHLNCKMDFADEEHQKMWIKWRKYEYYHKHKTSVELYSPKDYSSDNVYSPNVEDLKLSDQEAAEVYIYLLKKNVERKRYIEECKKDPTKKKELKFTIGF